MDGTWLSTLSQLKPAEDMPSTFPAKAVVFFDPPNDFNFTDK
ncbi:hypothetical protein [Brucella intermedia]